MKLSSETPLSSGGIKLLLKVTKSSMVISGTKSVNETKESGKTRHSACIKGQLLRLDELPDDILILLPHVLPDIETFLALGATCRGLRNICSKVLPEVIIKLAACSSLKVLQPAPYFVCAITARQLSDWAVKTDGNRADLLQALKGGISSLTLLNNRVSCLTIENLKAAIEYRQNYMRPLVQSLRIDGKPGALIDYQQQWVTVLCLSIYGDLFHLSFESIYSPTNTHPLSLETRFAFRQLLPIHTPSYAAILFDSVDWFPTTRDHRRLMEIRSKDSLALRITVHMGWKSFMYREHVRKTGDLGIEWEDTIRRKMEDTVITHEGEHNIHIDVNDSIWPGLLDDYYRQKREKISG